MIEKLNRTIEILGGQAYRVDIDLAEPMQLSFASIGSRPSGVVRMVMAVDGNESVGLGEGATLPEAVFTDDSGENIAENCTTLTSSLTGKSGSLGELIYFNQTYDFKSGGRFPTSRLAVEMALLDGYCKAKNISISEIIGTQGISSVPFGKSIGAITSKEMLEQSEKAFMDGAQKIKFKVSPHNYRDVVEAVQVLSAEHKDLEIMVDANGGFDVQDRLHLQALQMLDDLGLIMIEEPVSRVGSIRGIDALVALKSALPELTTPICLDDCLDSYATCRKAIDEDLADVINIKPGRIGSFIRSVELVDSAAVNGKQVMVGGMFEATPGRCMTVHLGAYCLKKGFNIPGDLSLAQERLNGDLVDEHRQLRLAADGTIIVPTGKGWGF